MILAILDLETTSDKPETTFPTEIGLVVYDTSLKLIAATYSRFILPDPEEESLTEGASLVTGIVQAHLEKYGVLIEEAFLEIYDLLFGIDSQFGGVDFFVAHNGNVFDRPIFNRLVKKSLGPIMKECLFTTPWIDTMTDINYPNHMTKRNLQYLCAEHRYYIQDAHRALNDCLATSFLLNQYSIDDVIERAMGDWFRYELEMVAAYKNRELFNEQKEYALAMGFGWDWDKNMRFKLIQDDERSILESEIKGFGLEFKCEQVLTENQNIEGFQHFQKNEK